MSATSVDVNIYNLSSRSSLGLHMLDNFSNQSIYNDQRTPLSNILQRVNFRIINIPPRQLGNNDSLDGKAINDKQKTEKYKDYS